MTHAELIAKAKELAERGKLDGNRLSKPRVREAVVVYFDGPQPGKKTEVYLDRNTGDPIMILCS